MAIQFARIELVGRNRGGNACRKGAYNARLIIKDNRTNITFNFKNKGDNVYHEILLPEGVNKKFKLSAELMNEIERVETRKNSSLLKDIVIALPDDKELNLQDRINITHRLIEEMQWVKEGLPVQIDIHQPHDGEKNWHAHILLPKRRFAECGEKLGAKARDLDIQIRGGKIPYGFAEDKMIHEKVKDVINNYFKELGLENRVDSISLNPAEHIGPVRMRSIFNEAAKRNEERRVSELEHLKSGREVLEKVTRHMSVFGRADIRRSVKCIPNKEVRERLVEDALSDKSVLELITNDVSGKKYYTTKQIRSEEHKLIRLSSYVDNLDNVVLGKEKISKEIRYLIENAKTDLTYEQHKSLKEILLSNSGLRIVRGRAGVGKSYVLGKVNSIASSSGTNVIGVAPTHRAKMELESCGFERVDTIKGMLFKLANGRFDLPERSLLVLDEAGMVGNDDYGEFLRVAATRKCNVILSGDERQLESVSRGGMFEVFANHYGSSTIFDIQRQASNWGKSVAMAFSKGEVEKGLEILAHDDRIKWEEDAESSMKELLHDWSVSGYYVRDRLILAVKNKDVASLNHGARQYLKLEGKLSGDEFLVGGSYYMKGDRILITKTNRELGLINGDLAELSYASGNKFTLRFRYSDNVHDDKYVSFDPSEYRGFRHGYATTVFKAQGASVKDVYVYHNGFSTLRNSYVSLSRHIDELRLFVNRESTSNTVSLTRQLSQDFENGSSLRYMTKADYKMRENYNEALENTSRIGRMMVDVYDFVEDKITKFADKYIPSSEYYNYREPLTKHELVKKVVDKTYAELEKNNQLIIQEKQVVGGNNYEVTKTNNDNKVKQLQGNGILSSNDNSDMSAKIKDSSVQEIASSSDDVFSQISSSQKGKIRQTAKQKFYANADRVRSEQRYQQQKEEWNREYEQLKSEVKFKAETISRDLLGEPNKRLSNGRELRYGDNGKIAVRITGEKAGTWYDFARGEGGDLFTLVGETKGYDFKESCEYLRSSVGMSSSTSIKPNLQLVYDHANNDYIKDHIQEKDAKIRYANKLHAKSKLVSDNSIAAGYLKNHRNITCNLASDIKTTGIYSKEKQEYLPALVAFARDKDGNITGGQQIFLDKETTNKIDIAVPKKSFGVISGSFVYLGEVGDNSAKSAITVISEGIETGLSIKQAMREHRGLVNGITKIETLCSLGINNIKNYEASPGEKIIIAADNDGKYSITDKTINEAVSIIEEKGGFVEIVRPNKEGDFNDILKDKQRDGTKTISESFRGAIDRHSSTRLAEYFSADNCRLNLSDGERNKIKFITQFNINEEKILNAYRTNHEDGKYELARQVKPIKFAHDIVMENKNIINEINMFGGRVNKLKLALELSHKYDDPHDVRRQLAMDKHIWGLREKYHILNQIKDLKEAKQAAKTPKEAMIALINEQEFLSELRNEINPKDHSKKLVQNIEKAHETNQSGVIDKLYDAAYYAHKEKIISSDDLTDHFKSNNSVENIHNNINRICYKHHCQILKDHCNRINTGEVINHHGKKFDCVAEYLEHWKENVNHDMLPIKKMDQVIDQVHEQHREHGHHLSLDM